MFFSDNIIIYVPYVYLVKLIYFFLFWSYRYGEIKMNISTEFGNKWLKYIMVMQGQLRWIQFRFALSVQNVYGYYFYETHCMYTVRSVYSSAKMYNVIIKYCRAASTYLRSIQLFYKRICTLMNKFLRVYVCI